jgi:hypothetical protein
MKTVLGASTIGMLGVVALAGQGQPLRSRRRHATRSETVV